MLEPLSNRGCNLDLFCEYFRFKQKTLLSWKFLQLCPIVVPWSVTMVQQVSWKSLWLITIREHGVFAIARTMTMIHYSPQLTCFRFSWNFFLGVIHVSWISLNTLLITIIILKSVVILEPILVTLWTFSRLMCLTHFLFHYLIPRVISFPKSRDEISLRGLGCNIPDVRK
jgi:hypothetical protein